MLRCSHYDNVTDIYDMKIMTTAVAQKKTKQSRPESQTTENHLNPLFSTLRLSLFSSELYTAKHRGSFTPYAVVNLSSLLEYLDGCPTQCTGRGVYCTLVYERESQLQPLYCDMHFITMRSEEMRFFSILLKWFQSRTCLWLQIREQVVISGYSSLRKRKRPWTHGTRFCIWEAFRCSGILLWCSEQNGGISVCFKGK